MPLVITTGFDIIISSICARSRHDAYISMRKPSDLALTKMRLIYNLLKKIRDQFCQEPCSTDQLMAPKTFHEQRLHGECIQFISKTFAFIVEIALHSQGCLEYKKIQQWTVVIMTYHLNLVPSSLNYRNFEIGRAHV